METYSKKIIILLGVPGSGKGTQAKMIAKKYKYKHISTGKLFRKLEEKKSRTPEEQKIVEIMESGKLVPNKYVYKLAFSEIEKNIKKNIGIVLDGAIRNLRQAKAYLRFFKKRGVLENVAAVEIRISDDTSRGRIIRRAKQTHGERYDDKPEIIEKRIKEQGNKALKPIVNYYRKKGLLKVINGEQTIKQVGIDLEKKAQFN